MTNDSVCPANRQRQLPRSPLPHQPGTSSFNTSQYASYTSWRDDATELLVSDGATTHRVPVPAVDPYCVMVEEMSSVVGGGSGWLLPLSESVATAATFGREMAEELREAGVQAVILTGT